MNEELEQLKKEVEELKETLKEHQHTGLDGSKEFEGETIFRGKEFIGTGSNAQTEGLVRIPFVANDGTNEQDKPQRQAGFGVAVTGEKGTTSEQITASIVAEKVVDENALLPELNKTDFDEVNIAQLELLYQPQGVYSFSGNAFLPPLTFLSAYRTPSLWATGRIEQGGSTLVDNDADFEEDALIGCVINLYSSSSQLEAHRVIGNTNNTITIGSVNGTTISYETWANTTGSYTYFIVNPSLLGRPEIPYMRVYIGEDIKIGYGPSNGTDARWIRWGNGSPEGVVIGAVGSLYLRFDGGANTTLYIKESGTGRTGWAAK
jgi:hypothetical protein